MHGVSRVLLYTEHAKSMLPLSERHTNGAHSQQIMLADEAHVWHGGTYPQRSVLQARSVHLQDTRTPQPQWLLADCTRVRLLIRDEWRYCPGVVSWGNTIFWLDAWLLLSRPGRVTVR